MYTLHPSPRYVTLSSQVAANCCGVVAGFAENVSFEMSSHYRGSLSSY